jgi:hypothetical protein
MIGVSGEQLKRSAVRALGLLGMCTATQAHADRTPEPLWQHVNLKLDVSATTSECPQAFEISAWVNELVGREFVVERAPVELAIRVTQAPNSELKVDVVAVEQTTSGTTRSELRRFQRALPCAELLRAGALTISLFAKAPSADPGDVPSTEVDAGFGSAKESLPAAIATGPNTARALPTLPSPSSLPSAAKTDPKTAAQPPSAVSAPAQPRASTVSEARAPENVLKPLLGASALGAMGLNPGAGLGVSAYVGQQWSQWELMVRGTYLASIGQRLQSTEPGTIYGATNELAIAGCPHFAGPMLQAGATLVRWCGFGGPIWVYARGRGFERDRHVTLVTVVLGTSAEFLIQLNDSVVAALRLEALVPLRPVKYRVAGESTVSWTMWPVVPRIGIGAEWR